MSSLSERCAPITAASSSIGTTALAFAQAGIHLGLLSRFQEQLATVVYLRNRS